MNDKGVFLHHTLAAAAAAPLLLPPPNTSFPDGLWAPAGGVPVGLCAVLLEAVADVGGVGVAVGIEPVENLPGLPSSRLPAPVKALNFGSSGSGGAASIFVKQRKQMSVRTSQHKHNEAKSTSRLESVCFRHGLIKF